jgi:hypothetical protein
VRYAKGSWNSRQVQRKGYRNHPLPEADNIRNAEIAVTQGGEERPFATYKMAFKIKSNASYGVCTKYDIMWFTDIAANIKKGVLFLGFPS